MLRNLRRALRSADSSANSNASGSSPSSPESTSTSLPDSYTGSTAPSSCSSQQSPESSKASDCCSSHSAKVYSPSFASSRDKPRGRSCSPNSSLPGSSATGDRLPDTSTTSTTTPKPNRSRLRKQSRSTSCRPDPITGDYTPKTLHRHKNPAVNFGPERIEETLRPVRSILRGAGADVPKQWVHVLNMTLEDLYNGKKFYFRVVRYRRSGRKSIVPLELFISPGTPAGTEIVVESAGNERRDGTLQAIVFLVKEIKHRFRRVSDDLLMEVRLPWVEKLNEEPGMVYFHSVDAKEYLFTVDYHKHQLLSGTAVIPGAGMPSSNGLGRGRVVIRYVDTYRINLPKLILIQMGHIVFIAFNVLMGHNQTGVEIQGFSLEST